VAWGISSSGRDDPGWMVKGNYQSGRSSYDDRPAWKTCAAYHVAGVSGHGRWQKAQSKTVNMPEMGTRLVVWRALSVSSGTLTSKPALVCYVHAKNLLPRFYSVLRVRCGMMGSFADDVHDDPKAVTQRTLRSDGDIPIAGVTRE